MREHMLEGNLNVYNSEWDIDVTVAADGDDYTVTTGCVRSRSLTMEARKPLRFPTLRHAINAALDIVGED